MGVFLLLALGVYCYRHRLHHHSRHYSSSNHEGRLRDSNNENDFEDLDDENKGERATVDVFGGAHTTIYYINPLASTASLKLLQQLSVKRWTATQVKPYFFGFSRVLNICFLLSSYYELLKDSVQFNCFGRRQSLSIV